MEEVGPECLFSLSKSTNGATKHPQGIATARYPEWPLELSSDGMGLMLCFFTASTGILLARTAYRIAVT